MKKFISLILTALIVLIMAMPVFATSVKEDDHDDLMFYRSRLSRAEAPNYNYSVNPVTHNKKYANADVYSGVDISSYQETVDWAKVKADGIDFAIIRAGYRGYGTGLMVADPYLKRNIEGARAAGLEVGVYFFTQAINEAEAISEADFTASNIKGLDITLPVFYDIEDYPTSYGGRMDTAGLTKAQFTKHCLAFCNRMEELGYKAGVYANKYWLESKLTTSEISKKYQIWLAHYTAQTSYAGEYSLWQSSDSATVNGVKWKCDFDHFYAVPPSAVTNYQAEAIGSAASITFDKSVRATGYEIYQYDATGVFQKKYEYNTNKCMVNALSGGTYSFSINSYYDFAGKRYRSDLVPKVSLTIQGEGSDGKIPSTGIDFDSYMMSLNVGENAKIKATMTPSNTTDKITWSSSNASVASVASNGTVAAKSAGNANITGKTSAGFVAICAVEVKAKTQITKVLLNKSSLTLGVAEQYKIWATVDGGVISKNTAFSSSDTSVATVATDGTITAKKVGSVKITAIVSGIPATCTVTVKPAPTTASLNKSSLTLGIGEQFDLDSYVNSGSASYKRVFTSSNSAVAEVAQSGGITTAKKAGTAIITLTCFNGVKTTCIVTVKPAPTTASLNKSSLTLGIGEQFDLDSYVNSGSASYKRVFTSSNPAVATVAQSGGITTAKSVGTAIITLTCFNGIRTTCTVTVKPAPTTASLNKSSLTLGIGEQFDLDSYINSGSASYKRIFTSSNPAVATVAQSGGITTAKSVGTAIITLTCFNGVRTTCTVTVKPAPLYATLNKSSLTLGVGEQFDLDSYINSGSASYKRVFTSSNPAVATVAQSGGITTAKKAGKAIITLTCFNGVKTTCTVTVK